MGDVSAEPSMEDILSSIKRIIAEDGDAASRGRRPARATARPAPGGGSGEILELSELAPDDAVPAATTGASADNGPATGARAADTLVSPTAAEASRDSLNALTRMIARPDADARPEAGDARTLEAFVADLLRPQLREWLDAHLPEIVEAMVAKEISRITGNR